MLASGDMAAGCSSRSSQRLLLCFLLTCPFTRSQRRAAEASALRAALKGSQEEKEGLKADVRGLQGALDEARQKVAASEGRCEALAKQGEGS